MHITTLPSIWLKLIRLDGAPCVNQECEGKVTWPNGDPFLWSQAVDLFGIRVLDLSNAGHDAAVLTGDMRIEGTAADSKHGSICQSKCQIETVRCPKPQVTLNAISTENLARYLSFPWSFSIK